MKTPLKTKIKFDLYRDEMYDNMKEDGIDLSYYMDKPMYLAPLFIFYDENDNAI